MSNILRNAIITPDGTLLESRHRHDYKAYIDANGEEYMVDGGLDYIRRNINKIKPTELLITTESPYYLIREYMTWGSYGKNGDEPLHYINLKDMETDHIKAILVNGSKLLPQFKKVFTWELELRDEI